MKLKEASDRFGRTAAICQRHLEKQGQLKAEWGKVDDATARSGITKNPLIAAANSRPVGPASATPQLAGENEPYYGSQRGHNKLQEFINSPEAKNSIRPISKAWSPFSGTSGDKRSYGGQVWQNLKNPYGALRELFGGSPNR